MDFTKEWFDQNNNRHLATFTCYGFEEHIRFPINSHGVCVEYDSVFISASVSLLLFHFRIFAFIFKTRCNTPSISK